MLTIKYPSNRRIFGEGDDGDEAFRVLSGHVEIFVGEGAGKVVLCQLQPGEVFGEMGMIDCRPRSASARAVGEVTLEVITRNDFNASLEGSEQVLLPYLSAIFERLRVTNERLHETLLQLQGGDAAELVDAELVLNQARLGPKLRMIPHSEAMQAQTALQEREIDTFPFLIGRRAEIAGAEMSIKHQLLIADSMPYRISRQHCYVERHRDGFIIRDRSSRRGTLVNGVLIGANSREKSVRLKEGTNTLVLGGPDSVCRFQLLVEV